MRLIPRKVRVFNVIQNLIPKSQIISIRAGTMVTLVFDTDIPQTANLRMNLEYRELKASHIKRRFLESYTLHKDISE